MNDLRVQMCDVGRRAYERQLVAGTEGNFSCLLDDGRVLCTPTSLSKGRMTPDDLCVAARDGTPLEGRRRPSSELRLHLAVYEAAPEVRAVVHAHPPFATTLSVLETPPPPGILPEAELFLGDIPIVPYETTGTPELAARVRPLVAGRSAVLLSHHGAVTWAADLETAYCLMETLEAVCRAVYQSRTIGDPQPVSAEKLAELTKRRLK